jgi:predicted transposase YbfD/YdcC
LTTGQASAIYGKTIRGAKPHGKKTAIHMVSAWACDNNLVLGQIKVDDKSNEITAILKLLEILDIKNSIMSADAKGCQKDNAKTIIDKDTNYILAVKENQASLLEKVKDEFLFSKNITTHTAVEGGHRIIETRIYSVITDLQHLGICDNRKNLKSVIRIESQREFKNSDKPTENAIRYYISSCHLEPKGFQQAIRSHWATENKLHWVLVAVFSAYASIKRNLNATQNYSTTIENSIKPTEK